MSDSPRPTLTVLGGAFDGKVFDLDLGSETSIGSDGESTICLPLPSISPTHARVIAGPDGVTVEPAGSPNGLFANDDMVMQPRILVDGDVLWLGPPGDPESVMLQVQLSGASEPLVAAQILPDDGSAEDVAPVEPSAEPEPSSGEEARLGELLSDPSAFAAEEEPLGLSHAGDFGAPAPVEPEPLVGENAAGVASTEPEPLSFAEPEPISLAEPEPIAPAEPEPAAASEPEPLAPAPEPPPLEPEPLVDFGIEPEPLAVPQAPPRAALPPPVAPAMPRPTPARRSSGGGTGKKLLVGALVVGVLAVGGYFGARLLRTPKLTGVAPPRAYVGQTVTLSGENFATDGTTTVHFGETPATVSSATESSLQVVVPAVTTKPGADTSVAVSVEVAGRTSEPTSIMVFARPVLAAVVPEVAMPGEQIELQGSGFAKGASVRFGDVAAEVVGATAKALQVRVPDLPGDEGASFAVAVSVGKDATETKPFLIGHLPMLTGVDPSAAEPGDVITLTGHGFAADAGADRVTIGGADALVVTATPTQIQAVVPRLPVAGDAVPLELRVPDRDRVAKATLSVAPLEGAAGLRLIPEPFVDDAGHRHAALSTWLGPLFVLSDTPKVSAAQRALAARDAFAAANAELTTGDEPPIELRNAGGNPSLAVVGGAPLLSVAPEDASGYSEGWTGAAAPVSQPRLALWWQALARDAVLLMGRGRAPHYVADLGGDGGALASIFASAGRASPSHAAIARLKPRQREALRALALSVPASVEEPAGEPPASAAPAPAAGAAPTGAAPPRETQPAASAPAQTTPAAPSLSLDGEWAGKETERGYPKYITVDFAGKGGSISYGGAVALTTELSNVRLTDGNEVTFKVSLPRGDRYYFGSWDGQQLTGRITTDAAGKKSVAKFEISRRR